MLKIARVQWRALQRGWLLAAACLPGLQCSSGLAQVQARAQVQIESQLQTAAGLTLADAIGRAKANEPAFAAAAAASKVADLDHSLARAALLPSVVYHNQYFYTEAEHPAAQSASSGTTVSGSTASNPRFIASNAVHEYTSLGVVSETLGAQQLAAVAHASAGASVASAQLEIARRGLVAVVVGLYYGSLAADHKVAVAQRALDEASDFTEITRNRENLREAAHADLVKAQLQLQQRQRDLADAHLASRKARLELGVVLFPDPRTEYALADEAVPVVLMSREEMQAAAAVRSPELKSALASLRAASLDVTGARAAYLPTLGLNFAYGIDAPEFAVRDRDGSRNLGYSATATLDIPVWDWFSTHDRIRQKESLRASAKVVLSATQRELIAQLDESYGEAQVARDQLQSLDESVATARESLRLVRLRYTAGESNVLEVVDAESSLITAELAREDGILRYRVARANLQLLTGAL